MRWGSCNRMKADWKVLEGALFDNSDLQYKDWQSSRSGVYTTNGAVLAVIKKSGKSRPFAGPLLFCGGRQVRWLRAQTIPCRSSITAITSPGRF